MLEDKDNFGTPTKNLQNLNLPTPGKCYLQISKNDETQTKDETSRNNAKNLAKLTNNLTSKSIYIYYKRNGLE